MRYVSCDVETFLIKPGVLAPRLVCMSVAEEGQPTALYDAVTACLVFRRLLRDPDVTIVGHNVAYDMLVLTLSADTMADTFAAYDDNRIADTKIRQELLDIAAGRTAGTGGYNMVFRDGQYVKAGYSLADLEKLYLGIDRSAEKHNEDAWRFKYDSLVDIPVSSWPAEAVKYAKADADNTLRVYKAQGARVPDEEEQVRAAWALHLTAWRGMRVDPERVAALEERMAALRQANRRRLIQAGLLKPKKMTPAQIREGKKPDFEEGGKPYVYSKDMARIKEYTTRVYRRQALPVPMTDKGAVCTDKDSLVESGSRLLATLAEGGGVDKIINTYMPVLKAGLEAPINTRYNVLVNSGRCIARGSLIETVRDVSKYPKGVPIECVAAGDYVYSYDKNLKLSINKVMWAGSMGIKPVIRLHWLGTGKHTRGYLDLTPDHKVLCTDGKYRRADKLKVGDHVAAMGRSKTAGYGRLHPIGIEELREHRFIYEQLTGKNTEAVHHVDGNKLNNKLDNLAGLTHSEHLRLHASVPKTEQQLNNLREHTKRLWREGRFKAPPTGYDNPTSLQLSKSDIEEALAGAGGSTVRACSALGHDYESFIKRARFVGVDLQKYKDSVREAKGQKLVRKLTKEDFERMLSEHRNSLVAACKAYGYNYGGFKKRAVELGISLQDQRSGKPLLNNHEITAIEILESPVEVFDLSVENVHNFIANEISVSNCSSTQPNLQNIPSGRRVGGVRECLVPAPGNALISVDYETLELRTLAQCLLWLFQESRMAQALNAGRDLHLEVAAQIVKCSYEEALAKHKNKDKDVKKARDVAKCFHPDTEVLTRSGWKRIEMLDASEEVAAVIPQAAGGLEVVWQLPVAYQRIEASAGLIHLSNESVDIRVTPDHRMLAFNLGGRAITTTPEAFSSARAWWSAGELDEGLDIPETTLRLIAATQADGSYERNVNGGVRAIKFGFSKTRKIERLEAIFKEAGIEYRTGIYPNGKHKPTTFFKIKGAIVADIVKWIPEKEFTYNLLTLSLKSRKILIEESRFWDGSTPPNGTGFSVCSVSKGCLEALQAACAISGYKATFTHNIYKANPKHKTAYSLSIKLRNYSRGGNVKTEQIAYTGPVVCLTVPADAILVRDAGKVIACHQCANFGYPGGLGADSFVAFARKSYGVKVTSDEAKKLKKAWQKAWPEMKPYFDYISRITESEDNKLKQLGTERVRGRLRFTEAANTLFQGLAGSGAKRALYETCKRAYAGDLPGLYPVAFIHDEILAEAPVDKVHEYGYALADTMISAMQKYVPDVKVTAKPVVSDCWSKEAYEKLDSQGKLCVWRYDEDKKSD